MELFWFTRPKLFLFGAIMINVYIIIIIFSFPIIAVGIIINHVCFCFLFLLMMLLQHLIYIYTSPHDHVFLPTKKIQNNLHNIDYLIEWIILDFFFFFFFFLRIELNFGKC